MSEQSRPLYVREHRLSADQHRIFFGFRALCLIAFFVWLFAFSDNFSTNERTWIAVALIAAVVINLLVARVLQKERTILAIEGNQLIAAVAPHEHVKTIDLLQVSRVLSHRQYVMIEQPNQAPVQLIFAGKYRPLQAKLLNVLTQEFPHIPIEKMK
ncbi:MAG: hypothetical protein ACI4NJ_02140 [Cellvibrio sp.]